MSYLERLKAEIAETGLPEPPPKPLKPCSGGFGGYSGGHVSGIWAPHQAVAAWSSELVALDLTRPLLGLDGQRWRQLLGDAGWLLDNFAAQAARDGWSAADLFGVLPGHDAWGGIADRLRGSRSLVMTADVARWRRMHSGLPDGFARGSGAMPRSVLFWDEP